MSGVSLDEEAANLMRFQKSYQASAQILQTSQTLFQTILGAIN
jgi:flagellar hook-associated protein 1 FlgK